MSTIEISPEQHPYDQHMAEYLRNAPPIETRILGTPGNVETNRLVVDGIARCAQTNHGEVIIADEALSRYGLDGLDLLTDLLPEPEYVTGRVYRLHKAIGVKYMPPKPAVCSIVSAFAQDAIEITRVRALQVARKEGVAVPEDLRWRLKLYPIETNRIFGPWTIDKPRVDELYYFLKSEPRVAELTHALLGAEAVLLKADTRRHKRSLYAKNRQDTQWSWASA